MAELWDIYDCNRKKTGRLHTRGIPLSPGDYHLVVNVFVMNGSGELLLTKRHPDKPWGNYWECTGGSVLAGETSLQGALREVKEETGIRLAADEAVFLREVRRESSFLDYWFFHTNVKKDAVICQPEEVIDSKWVNREEYEQMRKDNLIVPTIMDFYELYENRREQPEDVL